MRSADAAPDRTPAGAATFCTAINCMDGRVQLPVITYLQARFGVEYVDMVTEAGPVGSLADPAGHPAVPGIHSRVTLSLTRHDSRGLAVVAHHDCAGNPVSAATQRQQLHACLDRLRQSFPGVPVAALWVDEHGQVREVG